MTPQPSTSLRVKRDGSAERPFLISNYDFAHIREVLDEGERKLKQFPENYESIRQRYRSILLCHWPFLYDNCHLKVI
jgi:hypothetical protein